MDALGVSERRKKMEPREVQMRLERMAVPTLHPPYSPGQEFAFSVSAGFQAWQRHGLTHIFNEKR